jgi:hypothetical protein
MEENPLGEFMDDFQVVKRAADSTLCTQSGSEIC